MFTCSELYYVCADAFHMYKYLLCVTTNNSFLRLYFRFIKILLPQKFHLSICFIRVILIEADLVGRECGGRLLSFQILKPFVIGLFIQHFVHWHFIHWYFVCAPHMCCYKILKYEISIPVTTYAPPPSEKFLYLSLSQVSYLSHTFQVQLSAIFSVLNLTVK